MRTLRITILIALALFGLSQTQAAETEAAKKDLARLQGEWTMVSGSADGQPVPDEMRNQMKRVCTRDELTVTMTGRVYLKAKITLDPSKTPKTIDYQMTDGFTKGQTQLGIYEFDGETFKSSFGKPGGARPTDFTSKAGDGRTVSVWKRQQSTNPPEKK